MRWRTLVGTHLALDLGSRADAVHYRSLDRLTGTPWRSNSNIILSPNTPIGEPGIETSSYAVLDCGGSIQIGSAGTTLDLELVNVLDSKYPEIRASGFINPGSPRTLRAGVRFADQP